MSSRSIVLAVLAALILWPSCASAGTYDVYACRLPGGSAAPTHGWDRFATPEGAGDSTSWLPDNCFLGLRMVVTLPVGSQSSVLRAGWVFSAPADTTIAGFAVHRWVQAFGLGSSGSGGYVGSPGAWPPPVDGSDDAESCLQRLSAGASFGCLQLGGMPGTTSADTYTRAGLRADTLTLGLLCDASPGPCDLFSIGQTPTLTVYDARVTLADEASPTFASDPSD